MKVNIEMTEDDLKELIISFFQRQLGDVAFNSDFLKIEVKSKQNYRAEWETAAFRAVYHHFE